MDPTVSNVILLSGRPASGKTAMMIAYANIYPKSTMVLTQENSKEQLLNRGLSKEIIVIDDIEIFKSVSISKYETLCIDYIDLLDNEFIIKYIYPLINTKLRIIALQQMDRNGIVRKNIFNDYINDA
ncbi:DnaB-like helicase C-terminal domain-containing protein [Sulfurimonas hydrogeniphila]|uniref:DnaB-like helicase C-terminal domain-containing protein n=1 Tax=Sulfurimonas hydrogeniphila TaxID=2509341 RepID=UPI00125FB741|nr:DnaB-like helicase C-terminal domain-containing protein [Sulfurimonas hydrogeniphila]